MHHHRRSVLAPTLIAAAFLAPALLLGQSTYFHRGTATVDGVEGAGEWAGAEAGTVDLVLPLGFGGGSSQVTLLLMSDDDHFYFAVRLPFGIALPGGEFLFLVDLAREAALDPCAPTTLIDEKDLFSADDNQVFQDNYAEHLAGCDVQMQTPDSSNGGTTDGSGAWTDDGITTFMEIAHPLDTADDANDLSVALGDKIVVRLMAGGCDGIDCGTPADLELRLQIAGAGLFFLGDFESGTSAEWSLTAP